MTNFERAKRFRTARTELNQHGNQTLAAVYAATGVPASALSALENPESSRVPSSNKVSILADYYGVNVAWLAGQSSSPSRDPDIQMVTDFTGLTTESIRIIRNLTRDEAGRRLVNALIESEEFSKLLYTTQALRSRGSHKEPDSGPVVDYAKAMETAGNDSRMTLSEGDLEDMYLWKVQRLTEQMIRKALEKEPDG